MLPVINIGPLAIQLPGLILLLGLWLGLSLADRFVTRINFESNNLYNLVFTSIVCGVIGARLVYVIRYPNIFSENPASLISLNPGLLDLWGGLAISMIASVIYAQRKGLDYWRVLDAMTPMINVIAIALGLANLASGAAFGAPTDLPWGIELWGTTRHPSQIYQLIAFSLILIGLWPGRNLHGAQGSGVYFLQFVVLSSAALLFLEAFRGDSLLLPNGFRIPQILYWAVMAISIWGLQKRSIMPQDQSL